MTPTYAEYKLGSTKWRHTLNGVAYLLSHHGVRQGDEYEGAEPHPGTWCYYLLIPEQMYPHRWDDFKCTRCADGYERPGPAFDHDFFDSEITWSSSEPYFDRKTQRMWDGARVGCDYGHLWHMERGYHDTYHSVKVDAEHTVRKFLDAHPDRHLRCDYGGRWDAPENFYTARNGRTVHKSRAGTFEGGWVVWEPAEATA